MNIKWNYVAQGLATALQILNVAAGVVPPKYQPFVAFGVAIVQGGIALAAHYNNPDGTSAKVAWIPKP